MNEIAREKLAMAFGSIGMGIVIAIVGVYMLTTNGITSDGRIWGFVFLFGMPLSFWVSGHLVSHAFYPEVTGEESPKPEAPANGLPPLPTT